MNIENAVWSKFGVENDWWLIYVDQLIGVAHLKKEKQNKILA